MQKLLNLHILVYVFFEKIFLSEKSKFTTTSGLINWDFKPGLQSEYHLSGYFSPTCVESCCMRAKKSAVVH